MFSHVISLYLDIINFNSIKFKGIKMQLFLIEFVMLGFVFSVAYILSCVDGCTIVSYSWRATRQTLSWRPDRETLSIIHFYIKFILNFFFIHSFYQFKLQWLISTCLTWIINFISFMTNYVLCMEYQYVLLCNLFHYCLF